ncbi:MAG TPA: hypothetical protein VIM25_01310, partial [Candidatus Limnocylindrales bacterium]
APIPAAVKILKTLGLSATQLGTDLRAPDGIFTALDDLRTHLMKVGEAKMGPDGLLVVSPQGVRDLAKMFGGSRFGSAAMQLLVMADRVKLKYEQIGAQQATFQEKVTQTMKTTQFSWGQLVADLQQGLIRFGTGINPAIAGAIGHIDTILMSHMGDISAFGVSLGAAIDKIDWKQVENGAKSFIDILHGALDLISKIPPQILIAGAAFLTLNKLSGGLLGAGLGNIVGGLGKGIGNLLAGGASALLSKVPGIGGALSAATAVRVFVVNMPKAGFGGGGLPNLLPAVPAGLSLSETIAAIVTGAPLLLLTAAAVAMVGVILATQGNSLKAGPTGSNALGPNWYTPVPTSRLGGRQGPGYRPLAPMDLSGLSGPEHFQTATPWTALTAAEQNAARITDHFQGIAAPALTAIRTNTATAAQRLAIIAGIRITKPVPVVAKLSGIGQTGDPYGFKHLKSFSMGEIPMKILAPELARHLTEIDAAIAAASAKGDTKTVTKLQETKAGLTLLLGQVKDGTFHAGERAYQGALDAAARIVRAIGTLPRNSAITVSLKDYIASHVNVNAEWTVGGAKASSQSAASSLATTGYQSAGYVRGLAGGATGLARSPTAAIFGEAGTEGVAIIRNPRPFTGFNQPVRVDVRPQRVSLSVNGREIVSAQILSNAFTR